MGGGHPVLHRPSRGFVWATRHSDKIWTKSTNYTKFPGNESKPLLINELFTKYVCTSQNRVEVMSIELWRSVSEEDTRVRKSSEKVSRSTVWAYWGEPQASPTVTCWLGFLSRYIYIYIYRPADLCLWSGARRQGRMLRAKSSRRNFSLCCFTVDTGLTCRQLFSLLLHCRHRFNLSEFFTELWTNIVFAGYWRLSFECSSVKTRGLKGFVFQFDTALTCRSFSRHSERCLHSIANINLSCL